MSHDASNNARLDESLQRLAWLFRGPIAAQRLGGLTNLNYLVEGATGRFVVRIPGDGTAEYINRAHESVAARLAADVGVNVEVVFFDGADGLMVTRFADDSVTMSPARFAGLDAVARAAQVLRKLHSANETFATDFALFPMIEEYKSLLDAKSATLPNGYEAVESAAHAAQVALEAYPAAFVPSHCDPLCENFLDTGERMFLIDYEYAANNDPMWDLGDLSVEGGFSAEQDDVLLRTYFSSVGEVPAIDRARIVLYKALCDLLWTLWAVVQHVNGNPVDDFWTYAVGRFDRCRSLMASVEFANAVEIVRKG